MKLKTFFIIGLLILILSISFTGYSYYYYYQNLLSLPSSSPLYSNPGLCTRTTNQTLCLSSQNIYFHKILSKQKSSGQQLAEQATKWINQRNKIYSTVDVRYDKSSGYDLEAKINLVKNSVIFKFETEDMLVQNMINEEYFMETMNVDMLRRDLALVEKLKPSPINAATISLLYHMYHYKQSKLLPWMLTFPTKLPTLLTEITEYEMELLQGDITGGILLRVLHELKSDFIELMKSVQKHWNETEQKIIFKYHKFGLEDYVYARMVLFKCGMSFPPKQFVLLAFTTLYTQCSPREKQLANYQYQNTELEENKTIVHTIKIDRQFKKGEKISVEYDETGEHGLILRGEGYLEGYCIKLDLIKWEEMTEYQRKLTLYANYGNKRTCLKLSPTHTKLLTQINQITDYTDLEAKKCLIKLDQIKKKYEDKGEQFEALEQSIVLQHMEEECQKQEEFNGAGYEVILGELLEQERVYEEKVGKAKEYLGVRQRKKKREENARILVKLFEDKVVVIRKLKELVQEKWNNERRSK